MTTTETYQERIERERRETRQKRDAFIAKLRAVQLEGWTMVEPESDAAIVDFTHPTGARFCIELPGSYSTRNGKTEAWASWPRSTDGKFMNARDWNLVKYGEADRFRIGFSVSKSAAAIASDLRRRLVPQILDGIAKVNETLRKRQEGAATIAGRAEALRLALGPDNARLTEQSYYNAKLSFSNGSAYLNADTVDLKFNSLTHEQAQALGQFYATLKEKS